MIKALIDVPNEKEVSSLTAIDIRVSKNRSRADSLIVSVERYKSLLFSTIFYFAYLLVYFKFAKCHP
jgi:hypothetical protein